MLNVRTMIVFKGSIDFDQSVIMDHHLHSHLFFFICCLIYLATRMQGLSPHALRMLCGVSIASPFKRSSNVTQITAPCSMNLKMSCINPTFRHGRMIPTLHYINNLLRWGTKPSTNPTYTRSRTLYLFYKNV